MRDEEVDELPFIYVWCVCLHVYKYSAYLGINGRFYAATFMYSHLIHKVLSLSYANLLNMPFLRNLTPTLDEGLVSVLDSLVGFTDINILTWFIQHKTNCSYDSYTSLKLNM